MSGVRVYPHLFMPAKSKAQQRLMGLAYGNPEVRKQIGIKKKDARKMAKTKHDGLPERVTEDLLQELWDLYEFNVVDKPELQPDPEPSAISTPQRGNEEHPVIQRRMQVDQLRQQGMSDEDAHQEVHGEVQLADAQSKADFAATLARIQQDSDKRGIKIDDSTTFMSLLARTKEMEKQNAVTAQDLKSPMDKEVPDELEIQQQECYNFDVMYLQTYGRA